MARTTEIGPATREEVGAFYWAAAEHNVIRIDGKAVALGAIHAGDGRLWVMLNVAPHAKAYGTCIVRALYRYFHERNETVYAVCGFSAAERLLTVLGFAPTEETVAGGKRVWRWQTR